MKPLGTNNAAENELTTPKTNQPLKRCQFWIFTTLVNTEIERRYDNFDFELLPLDLAI